MAIEVLERRDDCVIAYNIHVVQHNACAQGAIARERLAFDGCWTGERWAPLVHSAMRFPTRRFAQFYIDEHLDQLVAAVSRDGIVEWLGSPCQG